MVKIFKKYILYVVFEGDSLRFCEKKTNDADGKYEEICRRKNKKTKQNSKSGAKKRSLIMINSSYTSFLYVYSFLVYQFVIKIIPKNILHHADTHYLVNYRLES